ncbi:MAG: hypothetical protein ACRC6H_08175 [Culicoidibacterales bacterium]
MYEFLRSTRKIGWLMPILILVVTYININIITVELANQINLASNYLLLVVITFLIVCMLIGLNTLFVHFLLSIFTIQRNRGVIALYSTLSMLMLASLYSFGIPLLIQIGMKTLLLNGMLQTKKFNKELFLVSLIVGALDFLLTLLLIWS